MTDDNSGAVVAVVSGSGSSVAWTWDGTGLDGLPVDSAGSYTATISAPGVTPAMVALSSGVSPPVGSPGASVDMTDLALAPGVITPNGDGKADTALISFVLSAAASTSVRVEDETGTTVATLADNRPLASGRTEIRWDGSGADGAPVLDGSYEVMVTAGASGQEVSRSAPVVVDRTLGSLIVSPSRFSPNGDGRSDTLSIGFELARSADVLVTIRNRNTTVATLFDQQLSAGPQSVGWDGALPIGLLADGLFTARVEATTTLGTRRLASRVIVDRRPPRLRVLSAVTRRSTTTVRLLLSEAVHLQVRGAGVTRTFDRAAGTRKVAVPASPHRLQLRAWDTAGNAAAPLTISPRR